MTIDIPELPPLGPSALDGHPQPDDSALEVLTFGRSSLDLYPEQVGVPMEEVTTYRSAIGGSPTNVAVAAARLGRRSALLGRVGDDAPGRTVVAQLAGYGVSTRHVTADPDLLTPVVLCELDPPADPAIWFYREPTGPDMRISSADLPLELVRSVPIFWLTASRLAEEPSRSAAMSALAARAEAGRTDAAQVATVIDLDHRPTFWKSEAEAAEQIEAVLGLIDVAIGNRAECRIAVGSDDPDTAADRLLERGARLAIVKLGADGVLVATSERRHTVAPHRVEVVCGLGAGDAFGGAVCHGLLSGWDPIDIVERANVAGALVAGRLMCSEAMPTLDQIQAAVESRDSIPGTDQG